MRWLLGLIWALIASVALAGTPAQTYYVDTAAGNDGNSGLDASHAWLTKAKVSGFQFNPGDSILFKAGQTSAGTLILSPNNRGTAALPIIISTYGAGVATFTPAAAANCIAVNDAAGYSISNITCVGAGIGVSSQSGIAFVNDDTRAASFQLDTIKLNNVAISGFNTQGLVFFPVSKAGYKNITGTNLTISGNGNSGIYAAADGTNFGNGNTSPSFSNLLFDHCTLSNDNFNETYFAEVQNLTVQFCKVSVNLTGNGVYSYDGSGATVQFNEVVGSSGFGIDFDIGSVGFLAQGNWVHSANGNGGNAGIEAVAAVSGTAAVTHNGTIRFNVIENMSQLNSPDSGDIDVCANMANMTNIQVYNNTIYESNTFAGQGLIWLWCAQAGTMTGFVANNVLYAAAGVASAIDTQGANPSAMTFTGNDYFMAGTFQIKWAGVAYPSFAAWQTATGQEKISGANVGLTSNPLLTNPGGGVATNGYNPALLTAYQLQPGSPMIGAGVNLSSQYGVSLTGQLDFYLNAAFGPSGYDVGAHSK